MPDRNARVWTGSEWENISAPIGVPNAIAAFQAAAPSSPVTGQLWVDQDDNRIYVWNGSSWAGATEDLSAYAPKASPIFTGTSTISGGDLHFSDGTTREGRILSSGDTFYIQAGTSSSDTTAKLNIARWFTGTTNISQFNIYSDNSSFSGKVGIGTTAPTISKSLGLHITGITSEIRIESSDNATGVANSLLTIKRAAARSGGIAWTDLSDTEVSFIGIPYNSGSPSTDLIFRTATIERMRINSSGNVGIGVTNPSNRLEVATSSGDSVILSTGPSTSAGYIAANGNGRSGLTGAVNLISYSSGVAELTNRSNAALVFGTNNTERMRIDSSGRTGIGTSNPQEVFSITGSSGTNPAMVFEHTGQASYKLGVDGQVFKIAAMDNGFGGHTGSFVNNDTQVISMTTTGNVGIGTTSPQAKLSILGGDLTFVSSASRSEMSITRTDTGATNAISKIGMLGSGTNTFIGNIVFYNKTTDFFDGALSEVMRIQGANVGIGTSSPNSSRRLHVNGPNNFGVLISGVNNGIRLYSNTNGSYIEGVDATGSGSYQPLILGGSSISMLINGTTSVEPTFNYSLPNTDNTAQWVRLGTFTASQDGRILIIRIFSHEGYNSLLSQNQVTELYFKTSNGTAVDPNGFAGDSFYWTIGRNKNVPVGFRIVANAAGNAATSYNIFAYFSIYANNSFYSVQKSPGSTWTHSGLNGQTDPGSSSSTVLIPSLHSPDISVMANQQNASYTLTYQDIGRVIEMNNASANTLTVPTDASVAFPIGTQIDIIQTGAGQTTVAAAAPATTTINANPGLKLSGQWATAKLIKRSANTWLLTGSLSA